LVVDRRSPVSRRQLLGASSAAGTALLLAACGGSSKLQPGSTPTRVNAADGAILNDLLAVEYYAASAYTAGYPLLSGHNQRLARRFLVQELSHIDELTQLVRQAKGLPHTEAGPYDLGKPRSATDLLELFHRVERLTIRAYLQAIPRLSEGTIRAAAVSILANEAQHVSIVRRNLGLTPVPAALVTGAE
jgi:bacterioferritin (cytochrome b1)